MRWPVIIQAPMAGGPTTPKLVAAVSNAGGLGNIGAGYLPAELIDQALIELKTLTDQPYGVNVFIHPEFQVGDQQIDQAIEAINLCGPQDCQVDRQSIKPPYLPDLDDQVEVLLRQRVPVVSFTFGLLPERHVQAFKQQGVQLIGMATSVEEALALQHLGVDALVVQGLEAGGHRGTFLCAEEQALTPLLDLLPQVLEAVDCSVIAAGGIASPQVVKRCLDTGAAAVQVGTAFLTTVESGAAPMYKEALLSQTRDQTVLTRAFSGRLARGINNRFIQAMDEHLQAIAPHPVQNRCTKGMRDFAKQQALADYMSLWAGQSVQQCRAMAAADLVKYLQNW